jgi:hypothetical protein
MRSVIDDAQVNVALSSSMALSLPFRSADAAEEIAQEVVEIGPGPLKRARARSFIDDDIIMSFMVLGPAFEDTVTLMGKVMGNERILCQMFTDVEDSVGRGIGAAIKTGDLREAFTTNASTIDKIAML